VSTAAGGGGGGGGAGVLEEVVERAVVDGLPVPDWPAAGALADDEAVADPEPASELNAELPLPAAVHPESTPTTATAAGNRPRRTQ
jgi:hypothetical protein